MAHCVAFDNVHGVRINIISQSLLSVRDSPAPMQRSDPINQETFEETVTDDLAFVRSSLPTVLSAPFIYMWVIFKSFLQNMNHYPYPMMDFYSYYGVVDWHYAWYYRSEDHLYEE